MVTIMEEKEKTVKLSLRLINSLLIKLEENDESIGNMKEEFKSFMKDIFHTQTYGKRTSEFLRHKFEQHKTFKYEEK